MQNWKSESNVIFVIKNLNFDTDKDLGHDLFPPIIHYVIKIKIKQNNHNTSVQKRRLVIYTISNQTYIQ